MTHKASILHLFKKKFGYNESFLMSLKSTFLAFNKSWHLTFGQVLQVEIMRAQELNTRGMPLHQEDVIARLLM